jgi:hypothetical protein
MWVKLPTDIGERGDDMTVGLAQVDRIVVPPRRDAHGAAVAV